MIYQPLSTLKNYRNDCCVVALIILSVAMSYYIVKVYELKNQVIKTTTTLSRHQDWLVHTNKRIDRLIGEKH